MCSQCLLVSKSIKLTEPLKNIFYHMGTVAALILKLVFNSVKQCYCFMHMLVNLDQSPMTCH